MNYKLRVKSKSETLDGMIYRSIEDLTTPKQGRICYVNRWWLVHPEKGAAFYRSSRSPQCNDWEHGVMGWAARFPGHKVLFIPVAYI